MRSKRRAQPPARRPLEMDISRPQSISGSPCASDGLFCRFTKAEVEQSIHGRFERIARRSPESVAVVERGGAVSYRELNATANRLARAMLERSGSEPEAVGLFLEKDASLIAAMLGVLKAGKFFVFLDPSLPQMRLAALLEDSGARLVIADRHN